MTQTAHRNTIDLEAGVQTRAQLTTRKCLYCFVFFKINVCSFSTKYKLEL